MKRNMSRGRGRRQNQGMSNQATSNQAMSNLGRGSGTHLGFNDRPGASIGEPLATDHLQLHDLDLELALLKRKRRLIEEQQQRLGTDPFGRPSQYNYAQPQSYNQQYDKPRQSISTLNFAHYYDSPGPQFDRSDRKRPAGDSGWQNSSSPKRFGGPQRDTPKQPGGRPGQYPKPPGRGGAFANQPARFQSNQQPNSGLGKPRDAWPNSNSPARGRNFNPTKVTKPKPSSGPNRLDSYPLDERRSLVSKASSLTKKPTQQDVILHADKPASRQMLGRMELALGMILKEIRQLHGDTAPTLGVTSLRVIKQAIRDRVRSTMLGKPVGSGVEIVEIYRAKYPKETNAEILKLGLEAEHSKPVHKLAIRLIETGNPEKFFKANFTRLVSQRLDEMFSNLHNLYKEEKDNGKTVHEIMESILLEEGSLLESVFDLKDSVEVADKLADKTAKPTEESAGTVDESSTEVKQAESQDEVVEDKTTKVESTDETQADITAESETFITDDSSMAINETGDNEKMDDDVVEITEPNVKFYEDLSVMDLSKDDEESKLSDTKKQAVRRFRGNLYTRLMDTLIKRRLPYILPKYKDIFKKILDSDEAYKTTLAHVIIGSKKRALACEEDAKNQEQDNASKDTEVQKIQEKPTPRMLPYFVKIFGHPSLPKRKLMQAFLDQFHPASIKKHRGIHNLLFVGFAEKEDFDNILAATQTVIGNCTVDITVSDKFNKPKSEKQKSAKIYDSEVITIDIKNDAPVKVQDDLDICNIDADLNDQINDLLTTIREEEEETRNEAESAGDIKKDNPKDGVENKIENKDVKKEPENEEQEESAQENKGSYEKETANAAPVASPAKAPLVASPAKDASENEEQEESAQENGGSYEKETANAAPVASPAKAPLVASPAKDASVASPAKDASMASPTKACPAKPACVATPAKAASIASSTPNRGASNVRTRRSSRLEK